MKTVSIAIINRLGMHARASAKFVTLAAQFAASGYKTQIRHRELA